MTDFHPPVASHAFVEGPAGSGKTTYAVQCLKHLVQAGIPAEQIMVLVPQRTLGRPYQLAMHEMPDATGDATVITLSGLARRNIDRFWPLLAKPAGFLAQTEPIFLTSETAQYHMMRFARPQIEDGAFDSINLPPARIAAQLLDNMAKAAIAGFPFEEVLSRLKAAWNDRLSSRLQVYEVGEEISEQYRAYCRENNLLDYALQLEVFNQHLLPNEVFRRYFADHYHHLIADNIEESGPLVHDFIHSWWEHWETALLVMDQDSGFRTFLGADPESALRLKADCSEQIVMDAPWQVTPELNALEREAQHTLNPSFTTYQPPEVNLLESLEFETHTYYPQMIEWVVNRVQALVLNDVPLREIVILAPFLSDSLRFALQSRLERLDIPTVSHRPSRALQDEPAARAMLTLLLLAHPQWDFPPPPKSDVVDMLVQAIDGLDPVRARLLANIVYKPQYGGMLSAFAQLQTTVRERITYYAGERYDYLLTWLQAIQEEGTEKPIPPDYFFSRLFGDVLSREGFGFHSNLDGGRVAAEMVESARKFRQAVYPYYLHQVDWDLVGQEYVRLVNEGVLSALYLNSWREEEQAEAVFLAPAFTFLMRNRPVDYQFWVDVGASGWWKRLEQPLTHPYVLMRDYDLSPWTEDDEVRYQKRLLRFLVMGLIRRCRRKIYLGMSDLGEQGFEQRGPLLYLFQQILQRHSGGEETQS